MPICANPECGMTFFQSSKRKIYCSKYCLNRMCYLRKKAREEARKKQELAASRRPPCSRCGEESAEGSRYCLRCQFELEAETEYRRHLGGWNSLALKGFLSDPYQRESFWAPWEGAHRPNFARGF